MEYLKRRRTIEFISAEKLYASLMYKAGVETVHTPHAESWMKELCMLICCCCSFFFTARYSKFISKIVISVCCTPQTSYETQMQLKRTFRRNICWGKNSHHILGSLSATHFVMWSKMCAQCVNHIFCNYHGLSFHDSKRHEQPLGHVQTLKKFEILLKGLQHHFNKPLFCLYLCSSPSVLFIIYIRNIPDGY